MNSLLLVVLLSQTPSFTGIRGRITDARTGEGLIEATVKAPKKSALTDLDGNFKLKLPPGVYELRVFAELYRGRKIQNVEVKAGQATELVLELEADSKAVQEVVVEAKADRRREGALLKERQKAAVVSDAIGAQEVARTADSNAGDAVKRVVSASVVDGRYVFLRGLGGRYALTLLNGALFPSPEPDEPSVPLDLFPTSLLSDLTVLKTYSPELPASFGGGTLVLGTNTFPAELEVGAKFTISGDTESTFRPGLRDPLLTTGERFGFLKQTRGLSTAFPQTGPVKSAERLAAAESLTPAWTPMQRGPAAPNTSLSFQLGNTLKFDGDRRLGFLFATQWSRRELERVTQTQSPAVVEGTIVPTDRFTAVSSSSTGTTSVLGNVGFKAGQDFELGYLALLVANAETNVISLEGENLQVNSKTQATRLSPVQRTLFFQQVRGFHRVFGLRNTEFDWQLNHSQVFRNEPDIRDFAREDSGQGFLWSTQPGSGDRFFVRLGEQNAGGTLNATIPLIPGLKLKAGVLGQYSNREFNGRRFRYRNRGGLSLETLQGRPEDIFTAQNLASDAIRFEENTRAEDAYTATQVIGGGYTLAEWNPRAWLRTSAGLRVEGTALDLTAASPFSIEPSKPDPVARRDVDFIPSVNATVTPRDNFNLRAGFSSTIARPTFRELGPFLFYDYVRRRNTTGNPDLKETRIHHADLRAEFFPGDGEVLAASVFYKNFSNPIERLVVGADGQFLFANTAGANLVGTELEARTELRRLWSGLKEFRAGANLSLIWSQISLGQNQAFQQTNASRPLQGQSPWLVNAFLQWNRPEWGTEVGVFYNVAGPRISEVGTDGLQDFYEQPFHQVDVVVSQRLGAGFGLKAGVTNVLNQTRRITSTPVEAWSQRPGTQFQLSLSWNLQNERNTQ